jgi:hypothetical protein
MPAVKQIEEILNDFYKQADEVIGVLSFIGVPDDDHSVREEISEFVDAVRRSFDIIKTQGYDAAWTDLEKASAGFIGLCRYKDRKFPNVNEDLSRKCAEAYRELPEPGDAPASLDVSLLDESNVKRMERAYRGITGEPKPIQLGQPRNITPLTQEQFEALQVGTPILIRNKFGGDPNWYAAEVTRGTLPGSIAPAINFKITDADQHIRAGLGGFTKDTQFIYYFSDAQNVAYQRQPGTK